MNIQVVKINTGLVFEVIPELPLLFFRYLKRLVFCCRNRDNIFMNIVDSINNSVVHEILLVPKYSLSGDISFLKWKEKEVLFFDGRVFYWYDVESGKLVSEVSKTSITKNYLCITKVDDLSLLAGQRSNEILLLSFNRSRSSILRTEHLNEKTMETVKFLREESEFAVSENQPGVFYVSHCVEQGSLKYKFVVSSFRIKNKSVLSNFTIAKGDLFDSHKGLEVYVDKKKNIEYILGSVLSFNKLTISMFNTINCQKVKNILELSPNLTASFDVVDDFLFLCGKKVVVCSLKNEEMKKLGENELQKTTFIENSSSKPLYVNNGYELYFLEIEQIQNADILNSNGRINILKVLGLPQDNYYFEEMDLKERLSYLLNQPTRSFDDCLNFIIRLVNIEIKVIFKSFLMF